MNYIMEIVFLILNFTMAAIHFQLIEENKPINHFVWTGAYLLAVGFVFYLFRNPWLIAAGILVREVFFSPMLNFMRKKPFFYYNPNGGSKFDKWEGKAIPYVYFTCLVMLITLQFIL